MLIAGGFALFATGCLPATAPDPDPYDGGRASPAAPATVDLSRMDFGSGQVVVIPTRWEFFWRRFLEPADFEKDSRPAPDQVVVGMQPWGAAGDYPGTGFATYRMQLHLPPDREYGFQIPQQLTAFRVFANGELSVRGGLPGRSLNTTTPERRQHSFYVRADESGVVDLIVHVANYHMFRGGMRGYLVVAEREAIDFHVSRKIAFDLGLFGFFVAVFLYHLALFVMHPREPSFLIFALLCVSFALRVPFMSEKTVNLLFADVSWETSLRVLGSINILSPAMMMVFLRSLFPEALSRRAVLPYLIVCPPFLAAHLFDIQYLAPVMFALYLIAILPMLSHAAYVTVRMGLRGSAGAKVMAFGILLCLIFGFYAMYLNWKAENAAPVAHFAFAGLVLFQSVGLGQYYRDNLDAREALRAGLARSREALALQRKDLEINLHDSLGGALTDLQVLVDRRLEDVQDRKTFDPAELLRNVRDRLIQMSRMFRGQLLFMEDLELSARDPVIGLRMILLRRYTDAEREIDFILDADATPAFQQAMLDDQWRMDFLQLTRELCTNDLKYGEGESRWRVRTGGPDRSLQICQSNRAKAEAATAVESRGESDVQRARERTQKMGGEFRVDRFEANHSVSIVLPLPPSAE